MTYAVILFLFGFVVVASYLVGAGVADICHLKKNRLYGILGFSTIQAVLFILYIPFSILKVNGIFVNSVFLIAVLLLVLIFIKKRISISKKEISTLSMPSSAIFNILSLC